MNATRKTSLLVCGFLFLLRPADCLPAGKDPLIEPALQNYAPIVIRQYATMASAVYLDALDQAKKLHASIEEFVAEPSAIRLEAARDSWRRARQAFLQSEVFRFSEGVGETGASFETMLNAWPIDPTYLDAKGQPDAGIIGQPDRYPELTPELLASLNRKDGEMHVSTGYHVLEFLLWGDTECLRPFTDYLEGTAGAAPRGKRRGQYLLTASAHLVLTLEHLSNEWSYERPDNYRAKLLALPPAEAVTKILAGMISLAEVDLTGDRMIAAFDERKQEAEQSFFSDNTRSDFLYAAQGIANVCFGRFTRLDGEDAASGPGIYALLIHAAGTHPLHPCVGAIRLKGSVDQMMVEIEKISASFHAALAEKDGAANREQARKGLEAVRVVARELAAFGTRGLHLILPRELFASDQPEPNDSLAPRVILHYSDIALATYEDSLEAARQMHTALRNLVEKPSPATLAAARQAWLKARTPYSQSEVFRFYAGPIDGENGPEELLNSWPMDEAYVDYVKDQPQAGIINDPEHYPLIDAKLLASLNQKEGETNVSTGYHAIEFLLWGQDFNADGPGQRPFTDYLEAADGTASHAKRRGEYVLATADLLIQNLEYLVKEWSPGEESNYRARFNALHSDEAIKNILTGMAMLGAVELAGERMMVAYDTQVQKEEQSCFSDNTHNDIIDNSQGIANVFYGRYLRTGGKMLKGPGILDLAQETWAAEPQTLATGVEKMMTEVKKIPAPFDQAILGDDTAPGRQQVNAAINSLTAFAEDLANFGSKLGLLINITSLKDSDD